jgi:hypothetical protein
VFPALVNIQGQEPAEGYGQVIQGVDMCDQNVWLQPLPYVIKGEEVNWNTTIPTTVTSTTSLGEPTLTDSGTPSTTSFVPVTTGYEPAYYESSGTLNVALWTLGALILVKMLF